MWDAPDAPDAPDEPIDVDQGGVDPPVDVTADNADVLTCLGDDECSEGEVCNLLTRQCGPPAEVSCTDALEPNDTYDTAFDLEWDGNTARAVEITLCEGDLDVFALTMTAGESIIASTETPGAQVLRYDIETGVEEISHRGRWNHLDEGEHLFVVRGTSPELFDVIFRRFSGACDDGYDCEPGYVRSRCAADGACVPSLDESGLPFGARCSQDAECASGSCLRGSAGTRARSGIRRSARSSAPTTEPSARRPSRGHGVKSRGA